MNLKNISFKANLIEQMQMNSQSATATAVSTPIADKKDSIDLSSTSSPKKPNKKTIIASIAGAIVLAIAIVKRKAINNFLKKLFDKTKSQTDEIKQGREKVKGTAAETTTKAAEKIEFPKPNFTCGPENQEKYAKEKKAYVDSIMPYLYKRDKQLKIKAIEAIEKYGSWEHGDKLGLFLGKRDEDIVVPVVRAIAATGKKDDALLITSFIEDINDVYTPKTFKEILSCAAKLGDVKGWCEQDANVLLDPIRRLTKSDNKEVAQAAKDALNTILNK